jgi:hypothetical protein
MAGYEIVPSARRLIKSLRGLGYDFSQAVADIVDNSITAGANKIYIDIDFEGESSWVRIADNGHGMNTKQLREAMRYGSERDYEDEDLGKFGLGMKTASLSQCRRLTVASKPNKNSFITSYRWDLDHVEQTNRWEILPIERDGIGSVLRDPLKNQTGTVVLWEFLDKIIGYQCPDGEKSRKKLIQMCREVETHMAMVFHRYLKSEGSKKKISIFLNGNEISPWDPFCIDEAMTKVLHSVSIPLIHEGVSGEVVVKPHIVPKEDSFSTPDGFKKASGPNGWNQHQGFYIYRAGRLIQPGGWSNLRAVDEHTKLARVGIFFSPKLDDAFKINVAKMRVQIPSSIRDAIRDAIGPVIKIAREIYDKKSSENIVAMKTITPENKLNLTHKVNETVSLVSNKSKTVGNFPEDQPNETFHTLKEFADKLLNISTSIEKPIIRNVLIRLNGGADIE